MDVSSRHGDEENGNNAKKNCPRFLTAAVTLLKYHRLGKECLTLRLPD